MTSPHSSTDLEFTLSAEATNNVYEALVCLAKFGESVSLEARGDKFIFTALNLSKTAYAACTFNAKVFCIGYKFKTTDVIKNHDRFTAQLYNKALQNAFKGRSADSRGRETTIDHCQVTVSERSDKAECRLIVRTFYKNGMVKCYRLTYEPTQIMHALFDRSTATQSWKISSRVMREYVEFFGPKTEQLDLLAQDGKAIFTSFTEKIQDGKEVLKQPLETSITLHIEEFEDFHVREQMHIVTSVKDFRAIVMHAETLHGSLAASFSQPTKPMQLSYGAPGIQCDFTLMTTGDNTKGSASRPNIISNRSNSRQPASAIEQPPPQMPPPALPIARSIERIPGKLGQAKKSILTQTASIASQQDPNSDSLFVPQNDDSVWDVPNYEEDGQHETLGYNASYGHQDDAPHPTFRDSAPAPRPSRQINLLSVARESQAGLEPTQRLSQLHGMFD